MAGYGSDSGLNAWLAANGLALPAGAPPAAVLRERGSVYVDGTYELRVAGNRSDGYAQERAWPRTGASAWGQAIPDDVIPDAWVQASYQAGYAEAVAPGALSGSGSRALSIKRERVEGVVDIDYYGPDTTDFAASLTPIFTTIEGLVAPFVYLINTPAILVI